MGCAFLEAEGDRQGRGDLRRGEKWLFKWREGEPVREVK